jgi:hypothetical protein
MGLGVSALGHYGGFGNLHTGRTNVVAFERSCIVTTNEMKEVLLWCAALNYTILFVWFGVFVFAHDWLYGTHRRWFNLSIETFDAIHYGALSVYKIGIILLNLVPLVALCLQ